MVIAIGMNHSSEASKETHRGIAGIETLTAANQTLISTLDKVMKIQEGGPREG